MPLTLPMLLPTDHMHRMPSLPTENWQGWVHEGEQVVVPACQRPVTSNLISNGAPARPQYCLYDISEIIAAYQEKPYGNNRRYPYTSRILLPNFRRGYLFNSV